MTSDFSNHGALVTGGAGFIGSHLVEELVRRGARVTVVDNLSDSRKENLKNVIDRIALHTLDLARDDLRLLFDDKSSKVIFHLAGHASVPRSVQNPRQDLEKNLLGTFNLLEAVRQWSPATRILFASSAAVYGEGSENPIGEDSPVLPLSPYGVSKLASEHYLEVYGRLYGLQTARLRLFPVYGPRLRQLVIYDLMRRIHDNPYELAVQGDGTQVRDFNHVANVVDALLLIAQQHKLSGQVYNVASDESVAIKDLAQMICELMSVHPRFVYSGAVQSGVSQSWPADVARIKGLGYAPRIKLAEGLADTVAWFRQEIV